MPVYNVVYTSLELFNISKILTRKGNSFIFSYNIFNFFCKTLLCVQIIKRLWKSIWIEQLSDVRNLCGDQMFVFVLKIFILKTNPQVLDLVSKSKENSEIFIQNFSKNNSFASWFLHTSTPDQNKWIRRQQKQIYVLICSLVQNILAFRRIYVWLVIL